MSHAQARCGFTVGELLTVTFIVSLLLLLSLATFGQAAARARGLVCKGNLRQWIQATHLYATDNDDLLPKDGAPNGSSRREGWYVDLPRVLGMVPYEAMPWRTNATVDPGRSIWICPANRRRSNGRNLFHYCLNQHVNGAGSGRQARLGLIDNPETLIWLFDNGGLAAVAQQNNVHSNLHHGGAQFVFLDGHAAWFESGDYWDKRRNRGLTNHPSLRWLP